jgi:hypothetical protein
MGEATTQDYYYSALRRSCGRPFPGEMLLAWNQLILKSEQRVLWKESRPRTYCKIPTGEDERGLNVSGVVSAACWNMVVMNEFRLVV